jgi:ABC-type Na+ efflux pump permease subunit
MHRRRTMAILRKDLREYRRNRSLVAAMTIIPLVFLIQPLVSVFLVPSSAAADLAHRHELIYLLAIPALVPALMAAYAVVGEREQGTLEPVLTTPLLRQEFLLAKALAVLAPAVAISYGIYALFLLATVLFARAGVADALIRGEDVLAQIVFTPLITGWSIWLAMSISTRASEVRVAQQLSTLASVPPAALASLIAVDVIHASLGLALALGGALLVANVLGYRLVTAMFDRERLITGSAARS